MEHLPPLEQAPRPLLAGQLRLQQAAQEERSQLGPQEQRRLRQRQGPRQQEQPQRLVLLAGPLHQLRPLVRQEQQGSPPLAPQALQAEQRRLARTPQALPVLQAPPPLQQEPLVLLVLLVPQAPLL